MKMQLEYNWQVCVFYKAGTQWYNELSINRINAWYNISFELWIPNKIQKQQVLKR